MIGIRFHGRGGHGVKTASRILGTAAFESGFHVQDSPIYGAERRGAAVAAFTRIGEEPILECGVLVVPDFIANAGGVICASVEYHGGSESEAFARIAEKVRHNTEQVLKLARDKKIQPRQAALQLARERVELAMSLIRRPCDPLAEERGEQHHCDHGHAEQAP